MISEAEHAVTDLAMNNSRFHGDETLLVKFFHHPKVNTQKTKEAGRPIFEEVPYVQIMTPGNKDHIVVRPASEMDKKRFAEHFRKFEAREDQEALEGTLLTEWAGITRSQALELKYLNIQTVEQLAVVSDANSQGIMGIGFLKEKAIKFLESSKGEATAEALADLQAKYEALIAQMGSDGPQLGSVLDDAPKLKRKRRTKAEMDAAKAETAQE